MAGTNAVAVSVGLGADVTVLDTNVQRLRELDALYAGRVRTIASNSFEIERARMSNADLLIGAVLVPGAKAPKLVSNALVSPDEAGQRARGHRRRPGRLLRGHPAHDPRRPDLHRCTARCSTASPTCRAPSRHTSTYALTNVTLPYARAIADAGWRDALRADAALALGLNVHAGHVVNQPVAEAHGLASGDRWPALSRRGLSGGEHRRRTRPSLTSHTLPGPSGGGTLASASRARWSASVAAVQDDRPVAAGPAEQRPVGLPGIRIAEHDDRCAPGCD